VKVTSFVTRRWELLLDDRNDAALEVSHYCTGLQLLAVLVATLTKRRKHLCVRVSRLVRQKSKHKRYQTLADERVYGIQLREQVRSGVEGAIHVDCG
jgi:hypothetical protein